MTKTDDKELSLAKNMVLVLLSADDNSSIYGKTLLIKQAFVMAKEIVPEMDSPLQFYPFQIGPYSTVLAKMLNKMIRDGLLQAETVGNRWTFTITDEGERLAEKAKEALTEDQLLEISKMKRTTSEWGTNRFLRYVYENYPEYAIDSRLDGVILNS